MKNITLTVVIEKDTSGMFVGYVPSIIGAHSQGETIDELKENLKEVISLCVEEGDPIILSEYIGTEQLEVMI